jgi:heptosyltransferase-2
VSSATPDAPVAPVPSVAASAPHRDGGAPAPTALLAFRNGSIGNTLVALPALRALRRRYPNARLSVVVDPIGAELLAHVDWIDDLVSYDKRGADRGARATLRFVRRLRALRPSHAILFKRFFRNGLLARLSGARVRAGYSTGGRAPFLNLTLPYREGESVARLNLELAALLDARPEPPVAELPLGSEDRSAARALLDRERLAPGGFVTAHYGGLSTDPGFLPPVRFADLVRRTTAPGEPVLLLGHGHREEEAARWVAARLDAARLAIGRPIRVTAALIALARRHVGLNSGPAHLAAAVGTPALVVFRPGPGAALEVAKWLPPTPRARALVPPTPDTEAEWAAFLEAAARTARELDA